MFPTWFISMSTQLYLFAPLFFLSMFFYPICGVALTVFVLLISPLFTLLPRLMSGFYSYAEVTKFTSLSDIYGTIMHYHMNPALYVTALTIGMLTGFSPSLPFRPSSPSPVTSAVRAVVG